MSDYPFPRRYRRWWNSLSYDAQDSMLFFYLVAWFLLWGVIGLVVLVVAA